MVTAALIGGALPRKMNRRALIGPCNIIVRLRLETSKTGKINNRKLAVRFN